MVFKILTLLIPSHLVCLSKSDLLSYKVPVVGDVLKLQARILQRVSKFNEVALVLDTCNMVLVLVIFPFKVHAFLRRRWRQSCLQRYRSRSLRFVRYMLRFVMLLEFSGVTQNVKFRIHRFETVENLAWFIRIADSVGIDYVIGL